MPVDTPHPEYSRYLPIWEKCEDFAAGGEDRIKAPGVREKYLRPLTSQKLSQYEGYVERAMFYAASERTLGGLLGSIFRKLPTIDNLSNGMDVVGREGGSIGLLSVLTAYRALMTGRQGLLIDVDRNIPNSVPYIATYPAQSIINWGTRFNGFKEVLDLLVLRETVRKPGDDKFSWKEEYQYRVLELEKGKVVGTLYQKVKDKWVGKPYEIKEVGQDLKEIPFVFINGLDNTALIRNPIILPVVNVNLSHYRSSADLENGRHFCGLPTPYLAGFNIEGDTFQIGSETGYVSKDPQANAGYMEFTGAGLKFLESALKDKENLMAILGARLLEQSKKGIEAEGTIRLRQTGENSALSQVAGSCSQGLTTALEILSRWRKKTQSPIITLNTDFVSDKLSPQELKEYVYTWQSGGWSWETLFYNLKKGEMYPVDRTAEEEKALIEAGTLPESAASMEG